MLDRDGTINKRIHNSYLLKNQDIIRPIDFSSLVNIHNSDIIISIVSNQPCISKKIITYSEVVSLTQFLVRPIFELSEESIFICPHQEKEGCDCRKPKPGLILKCLEYFDISPDQSIFVGDTEKDATAAREAGVQFFGVCWDSPCLGERCFHTISNVVSNIIR
jgi:D-glycero-D-manno-heptose 1,7-bisphosphate phosphatase